MRAGAGGGGSSGKGKGGRNGRGASPPSGLSSAEPVTVLEPGQTAVVELALVSPAEEDTTAGMSGLPLSLSSFFSLFAFRLLFAFFN